MVVKTQTERLNEHPPRRDGALHLRPSARLPDLRGQRRIARLQTQAGVGRPARRPLRLRGRQPRRAGSTTAPTISDWIGRRTNPTPISPTTPSKCIVCSRCVRACEEVQGTFALTIEGRGFDSRVSAGMHRALPRIRMRVLRRLRAGLPDRRADARSRCSRSASRSIRSSPPAPIAASAARSRPRCAATRWCAWCRGRTARPIAAIPA